MFSAFTIVSIEETNLSGNQWRKDMKRLKWEAEGNNVKKHSTPEKITFQRSHYRKRRNADYINNDPFNIDLKPMEIKTFIVKVSLRKV